MIATLKSYADCLITSGAIQNGVPTKVNLFIVSVNCPATPKSASLTSPLSESKTLAAAKETSKKRERERQKERSRRRSKEEKM